MSFELPQLEPNLTEQIREDLRDLFRNTKSPIAILLATMETQEFKGRVPAEVADPIRKRLEALRFENEDEFVEGVLTIAMPVLEITARGRKDAHKQEGREMYTQEDMKTTISLAKEIGAQRIFVVGNVGSGKTTFSRELARATGYPSIDVDQWFQIFRQENRREAANLPELVEYILQSQEPPFIINHADLLRQGLVQNADMVVFLNPKKEEQLRSRELRTQRGAEGEWRTVSVGDYDRISKENLSSMENLGGETKYHNRQSGTMIRILKTNGKIEL